ncbi:6787_t:CDS:2, partial [Acaulospora colombiana]
GELLVYKLFISSTMSKFLHLPPTSARKELKAVQAINEDLAQIKRALSNENLAGLFEGRALYFCRGKHRNNKERLDKVAKIVRTTREEVLQLESIDIRTNTNPDRYEKEIPILKDGCALLNQLKKRPTPIDELDGIMDEAITKDRAAFDKRIKRINELQRPNPQTIRVRFMDEPSRSEEVITDNFLVYGEVRWHLLQMGIVDEALDVWVRHSNEQKSLRAPNLCYWEYVKPRQAIEKDKESLELDIVKIGNKKAYIVAVLQDMNDQSPMPLADLVLPKEIARGGGNCCNTTKCRDLREHLKQLWPSHVVTQIIRLSEPELNPLDLWNSSGEADPSSADVSPPTREARAKCWRSRDEFFACLDASKIASPADKGEHCKQEAAAYETNCAKR